MLCLQGAHVQCSHSPGVCTGFLRGWGRSPGWMCWRWDCLLKSRGEIKKKKTKIKKTAKCLTVSHSMVLPEMLLTFVPLLDRFALLLSWVSTWQQFCHKLQRPGCVYNHTAIKPNPLIQPSLMLGWRLGGGLDTTSPQGRGNQRAGSQRT